MGLHTLWFLLVRLAGQLTRHVPWLATASMVVGSLGTLLAAVALLRLGARSLAGSQGSQRVWALLRLFLLVGPLSHLGASLYSESAPLLQSAALYSGLATLCLTLGAAGLRMRHRPAVAVCFTMLLVGQCLELLYAPLFFNTQPDSPTARFLLRAGAVSEACAVLGALLSMGWSVRSASATVGLRRARMFIVPPALMVGLVALTVPFMGERAWKTLGRVAWGLRADLAWFADTPARPALSSVFAFLYALTPSALLVAITSSVSTVGHDRGEGALRAMGWCMIFFGGFAALRLGVAPVDPLRTVLVLAGAALLERATALEARSGQ